MHTCHVDNDHLFITWYRASVRARAPKRETNFEVLPRVGVEAQTQQLGRALAPRHDRSRLWY